MHSKSIVTVHSVNRCQGVSFPLPLGIGSKFKPWLVAAAVKTKGGSITLLLTSCLTGLELAVWQLTIFVFVCKRDKSKQVKQEVNCTVILPPLVFPGCLVAQGAKVSKAMDEVKRMRPGPSFQLSKRLLVCLCFCCCETKRPNLKLKTRPKQLLGSLPLAFALPDSATGDFADKASPTQIAHVNDP